MAERLRIAQIAPVASRVVKESGGSIEQIVWLLTEELVRRGHDVTLCATGDSQTSAQLHAVYPTGYGDADCDVSDWRFREVMHAASVAEQAERFDIIHSHVYQYALPFTRLVGTPIIHTFHVMPNDDILRDFARYPEAHIAAISAYQAAHLAGVAPVGVVHHGIATDAFTFNPAPGDYLLFLGRVVPRKGPVEAIHAARAAGLRLVIAGGGDEGYINAGIAPLLDGKTVEHVGYVSTAARNGLLAGAAALLFPAAPEPFGLTMIEAMACGTPVVALNRGAVPEIVDPGLTGYYTDDVASLADAIPHALALDRRCVRARAVARFDYRRMADEYEALYRRVAAERRGGPR